MIALRHVLAPAPRVFTADLTALGTVALLAAAATPPVIASISEVRRELHHSVVAAAWVMIVTVGLSVLLARRALQARSSLHARAWLVYGGPLAGILAVATSYAGVVLLRGDPHLDFRRPGEVLFGSVVLGAPLGCLFGIAYAPVVAAAVRARVTPSVDAADRALFAAGASLLSLCAAWKLSLPLLDGPPTCALAGLAGAIAATLAGARLVARVRLLRRARDGAEPGFHIVPRTGRDDEAALVPLVRASVPPSGVLAATGMSAPYRGARGVFKLALAPLAEQPWGRPVLRMIGGALGEVGNTMTAVVLGALGMWMAGMLVFFVVMLGGSFVGAFERR